MIDSRLHYITQEQENHSHECLTLEACTAGVKLVQLRMKNKSYSEMGRVAAKVKKICLQHKAALIVNDFVSIAQYVDADGVHLGNHDMDHAIARSILGERKIIGGTAYNIVEAEQLLTANVVNYIGIGAFRATATKPEITTFLTTESIREIIRMRDKLKRKIQLILIGGIRLEDVPGIVKWGLDGIAVASMVTHASDKQYLVSRIYSLLAGQGIPNE